MRVIGAFVKKNLNLAHGHPRGHPAVSRQETNKGTAHRAPLPPASRNGRSSL